MTPNIAALDPNAKRPPDYAQAVMDLVPRVDEYGLPAITDALLATTSLLRDLNKRLDALSPVPAPQGTEEDGLLYDVKVAIGRASGGTWEDCARAALNAVAASGRLLKGDAEERIARVIGREFGGATRDDERARLVLRAARETGR